MRIPLSIQAQDSKIQKRRSRTETAALPYLLLLPTLFFVAVFTIWPLLRVMYDSLFIENQAVQIPQFTGLGNYSSLFRDPFFRDVISNTLIYVITSVPVSA